MGWLSASAIPTLRRLRREGRWIPGVVRPTQARRQDLVPKHKTKTWSKKVLSLYYKEFIQTDQKNMEVLFCFSFSVLGFIIVVVHSFVCFWQLTE